MKQGLSALIAMTCFAYFASSHVQAQAPKTVSVSFRNQTGVTVVVQGYTTVNGVTRPGQAITVLKNNGGVTFESNVPPGVRFYYISDANSQARVYLRREPITIPNRDAAFVIMVSPTDRTRMILVPE